MSVTDNSIKKRILKIIQIGSEEDLPSRLFDYFITTVIIVNILVLYIETFTKSPILDYINHFCFIVFLIEYLLRLWTADLLYSDNKNGKKVSFPRLTYMFSFNGIVELLTCVSVWAPSGFVVLRLIRVVRILRLFQVNAYSDAFSVIVDVLRKKRRQLTSSMFLICMLALFSSLLMYNFEHEAQPEVFSNAFSGIWWAISTLLTVGYGDIYPVTLAGRICGIIIAFLGVGMVAIPTGIISAGFIEVFQESKTSDDSALGDPANSFSLIEIDIYHPWTGLRVGDVELPDKTAIAAIVREGVVLVPDDELIIKVGDRLLPGERI